MIPSLIVLGVFFVLVILPVILIFNGLVAKRNQVEYAFSSIDTMLKKRIDLIPNLVATVKQYMDHESEVLTEVTKLRSQIITGGMSDDDKIKVENKLTQALSNFIVTIEKYPDLKANQNFNQLQRTLNETEEQISASRRSYNASVMDFNNGIEMFPSSIIAAFANMRKKEMFEIPETERRNVDVSELFDK
ncbi:MAG: LemA family protein [Planctomycetota bacterium]|nr:MAG: LemA family protein [Planctomycetota bacterium]